MKTSLLRKSIRLLTSANCIKSSIPVILFLTVIGLKLPAHPLSGKTSTDFKIGGTDKNFETGKTRNIYKAFYFQKKPVADTVIRGRVTTKDGVPLQGVSITVKGKNKGTTTNETGAFILSGVLPSSTVVISIIGFESQEIKPAGRTSLIVALEPGANTLTDVVVTGFQNIDKKKFTGAAVTLKATDVRMDGYTDVSRMLEGKAAGVSVQNVSSTFGSAPKVRIRGATSINGDNKPLWVVDGVVLEDIVNISNDQLSSGDPTTLLGSPVAGINANDIESFDILKDAAATALYGARAMNGVVVITTKKGRSGKPSINYTGNFSTQLKPMYADFNIMNSAQQMSLLAELERKGVLTTGILANENYGVYGKMYSLLNPDANGNFPLQNTTEAKNAYLKKAALTNTDWFNTLFRNSLMQEHSLSISSGTEKSQHFFSTSFYNDNGWTIADNVKRYTLNFRNNYTLSDRLTVGFLTTASVRQQKVPGTLKRVSNPVTGEFDRDFDINPFGFAFNTSRTLSEYDETGKLQYYQRNYAPFNVVKELQNNYIDISVLDLKLQGELSYKITKNLKYDFIGALRYVKSTQEHQITEGSNMANAYRSAGTSGIRNKNKFLYRDPDNPGSQPIIVLPYGGFYNRTEDRLLNFDVRNSLNYTNTIADKHNINILLGQQVKYADRQNFNNTGYGYQYDNGGIPFVDYRILKQTIESSFPYYDMTKNYDRFAAFYLNAQYTYDRKYNFYGTVRYDGSNQLGSSRNARWLPTWSFGGSWNIDEEGFMKNVNAVDYLKLRASYGLTASLGPATNSNIILKSATTNRTFPTERESVLQLINLENADLTWEKNYQTNLGLDGGFFKGKLTFSLDVYSRKSFDLISTIKVSGIGGEALKAANYADLTSRGAELLVGGQVVKRKNWGWRTSLTFGYNDTKISNVKNHPLIFDLVKAEGGNTEGHPVSSLFSVKFNGLSHTNGVPLFINQEGKQSTDVYLQSDSIQYLKYEGPVDPKITGGFANTFTYKSFSLYIFITYQAGNKIRLYPVFKTSYSDFNAFPKEFNDRWEMPGDESITKVPSIVDAFNRAQIGQAYPYNNYNYSTERVADGGFVRLKTVSITYNMESNSLKRIGFNNVSLTAAAINPLLIYSDPMLKGQDPEFYNSGGVAQPIQKQITLSLKLGL